MRRVPFKLPELIEGIGAAHPVFIVEGERDVLTLNELGIVATTNPGGAGQWRPEFSENLRGADVILVPDNDEPVGNTSTKSGLSFTVWRPVSGFWCCPTCRRRAMSPTGLKRAARANSSMRWLRRLMIGSAADKHQHQI